MNDVSDPRVALDTVQAETPVEIRRRVASIIRQSVGADLAVFTRYSLSEEGEYFTSIEVVGVEGASGQLEQHRGEGTHCPIWDPHYPPKEAEQKFDVRNCKANDASDAPCDNPCDIYAKLDIAAEASALLYDGVHFLGWLAVFQLGEGSFDEGDIEMLDSLVDPAARQLAEAEQLEVEMLDDKPAWILVNPELLEVECATGNAFKWLTAERKEELLAEIDQLASANSFPRKMVVDGYAVWANHMSGELGRRLLATVEHAPIPEKQPDAVLTPRQREVVGYAAAGATNREIAETLGITPDTVSDHLSEAYDRLGVANRVELALKLTKGD